jgi:hypothetical protein
MAIQTAAPLSVGSVHEFDLTLGDGATVALAGRVVHTRLVQDDAAEVYVSGIQFMDVDSGDSDQPDPFAHRI